MSKPKTKQPIKFTLKIPIGKLIKVKIEECNQNSLFGKIEKNNMRAA